MLRRQLPQIDRAIYTAQQNFSRSLSGDWAFTLDAVRLPTYYQDPQAKLDYPWNWGKKYLAPGETIETAQLIDQPALVLEDFFSDESRALVWVSMGEDAELGVGYVLTCEILTSLGRVDQRSRIIIFEQL